MAARDIRNFNPDTFAKLDADMWVAYYNHRFFTLFILLLRLNYIQFRPSLILTARGAYHSAKAAIVFRKTKGHEDTDRVLQHLVWFYKLLSAHSVTGFDYQKAAELELQWWFVDRYPERYKVSRATALAEGMAAIYDVPMASLKVYGKNRAAAMELLGDYHHDITAPVNWDRLRNLLKKSYRGLYAAVQSSHKSSAP